jgi:hypothetical protein
MTIAKISAALTEVMRSVAYVQKDRRAEFGDRYKYASEAAFIGAVRDSMVKNGLVLRPLSIVSTVTEHAPTKQGSRQFRCDIHAEYELTHSSGETLQVCSLGCGIDVGDKAAYKAMTGAYKYAIRQLLMLETGDDPDHHHSSAQESPVKSKSLGTIDAAFVSAVQALGVDYEALTAYLVDQNQPLPAQLPADRRAKLLAALEQGQAFRAKLDAFIGGSKP